MTRESALAGISDRSTFLTAPPLFEPGFQTAFLRRDSPSISDDLMRHLNHGLIEDEQFILTGFFEFEIQIVGHTIYLCALCITANALKSEVIFNSFSWLEMLLNGIVIELLLDTMFICVCCV
jgi:hypothetical protein